jgi:hypothetical protein
LAQDRLPKYTLVQLVFRAVCAKVHKQLAMDSELFALPSEACGISVHAQGYNQHQRQLRKTKQCRFHAVGRCRYGAACGFAHSDSELKEQPDLSKTKICRDWRNSFCSRSDCRFAHGIEQLHERPPSKFTSAAGIEINDWHKQIQTIQDSILSEIAEQSKVGNMSGSQVVTFSNSSGGMPARAKLTKLRQLPVSLHARSSGAQHTRSDSIDLLNMEIHEIETMLKQGMPDAYFD